MLKLPLVIPPIFTNEEAISIINSNLSKELGIEAYLVNSAVVVQVNPFIGIEGIFSLGQIISLTLITFHMKRTMDKEISIEEEINKILYNDEE